MIIRTQFTVVKFEKLFYENASFSRVFQSLEPNVSLSENGVGQRFPNFCCSRTPKQKKENTRTHLAGKAFYGIFTKNLNVKLKLVKIRRVPLEISHETLVDRLPHVWNPWYRVLVGPLQG